MGCRNEKYNPKEYGKVSLWVKMYPGDWQSRVQEWYVESDANAIIDAVNNGTFNSDFGRIDIKLALTTRDPLTNSKDVKELKAHYVNVNFSKTGGDFDKMARSFKRDMIENVLLDSNYKRIEVDKELEDGITVLNHNLYNYKVNLIKELRQVLFPGEELDYTYTDSNTFSLLISKTLSEFEGRRLTNRNLDDLWDTYFKLAFFDQLLSDFNGFVKLKPEYENTSVKALDMYESVKPYVAYDTSFNPNEFASAEQYASDVLKTLLDYFKEADLKGNPGLDPIGFKGFNFAVTRLVEWVEHQSRSILRNELDKGNDVNWSALIDAYISANPFSKEINKKLLGLKLVFNTPGLDSTIREMLNEQKERVVRYQFEQYRMMYDPKLHRNVLVPTRVEDNITDIQKTSIAKSIRTKVSRFRKNPGEYQEWLDNHNITYDRKANTFTLKNFLKSGGNLTVTVEEHDEKTYIFKTGNYNGADIDDESVKNLVQVLLNQQISDDYKSVLTDPNFGATNLWDVWGISIMRTLAASLTGNDTYGNYTFRKNGVELEFKGSSYADFDTPARFMSLMNGLSKITMTQNGLGNDLPIYQQISAIHKSNGLLRAALSNLEGIRSTMHNNIRDRFTIFDNSILKTQSNGTSPIGSIFVRSDYDYNGTNKNSAQMNFSELSYVSIMKSYYHNLFRNKGNILLQTTCLSDKHTHFMVEFLTSKMRLLNGDTLQNALQDASSLRENTRTKATQALLQEIKYRRDKKTRVQIANLINRYSAALGLNVNAIPETSFEELKSKIDIIHSIFNGQIANPTTGETKQYTKDELFRLCREAYNGNGVDYFYEADLINLGDKVYFNETVYHNFLTYCDSNNAKFDDRIAKQMMNHAKLMFKNHFILDANLDPDVTRVMNSFRQQDPAEAKFWIDEASNTMKIFRLFDKSSNKEIIPNYNPNDFEAQFDPEKVFVVLNPILNSHFLADVLLSNSFNDIVFGDDYGVDAKYLKDANKELGKLQLELIEAQAKLDAARASLSAEKTGQERKIIQGSINLLANTIQKLNADIQNFDYDSENFRTKMEASRLNMHYKRTVHGGATYTPLLQGLKWGVGSKVRVSAVVDTKDPQFSITGDIDNFTSQDGAGDASPYFSRMANRSYVDGAVGANKKTIFSYVDPETGILTLIKWAEYEITNAVRRDSQPDKNHASKEIEFKKMHNDDLNDSIDWDNFDISRYYNRRGGFPGITTNKYLYRKVINAAGSENGQLEVGKQYLLTKVSNTGRIARAIWQEVDEHGNSVPGGKIIAVDHYINSIYDFDQLFGGAYVQEVNNEGWLDWSEMQNDIVYTIICDTDIKDKFIGFSINISAIKSGMRNVNNAKVYYDGYNRDEFNNVIDESAEKLAYFEISTRTGGAQMNADHIISEAEVTEMSQMISALIQAGLKTNTVNNVYKFIGKVAAESLGNISSWINDPGKEDEVYKWIGEAVARSFQTGQGDTLGLAGAFIGRVSKNLQENGLKTKIPFSANTVKGIFEASITSFINNKAIHRKYPGGGFVQNPTYDVKPRFNVGGTSYSYTEFAEKVAELNADPNNPNKITVEQALTDYSYNIDSITGQLIFNNPFIKVLSNEERSSLDIDDTVITWDPNDVENTIKVVNLREFSEWDRIRNIDKHLSVAHWTCRPKNLLGSRTFFNIGTQRFSLYDLDSVRVSIYSGLLLDSKKNKTVSEQAKRLILDYLELHPEIAEEHRKQYRNKVKTDEEYTQLYAQSVFTLSSDIVSIIKQHAVATSKDDLRALSKIQQNGRGFFNNQVAFGNINTKNGVEISNINTAASQVLIGIADAKAFNIQKSSDLELIKKNGYKFFLSRLGNLTQKPSIASVDPNLYDIVAKGADGKTTLVIIKELHDSEPSIEGMSVNMDYRVGVDGNLYKNDQDLGIAHGKEFYKYIGQDGVEYDVLYCDTMQDFNRFNKENDLYSNTIDNYNVDNYKLFGKLRNGRISFSLKELNQREAERQSLRLERLAKQKYESWKAYVRGVATRIPAQSMQSFTAVEVVGFTNDDVTNVYISTMLAFLQGSDFDIDKLYIMRYGFTEDGKLATYSDLDKIFSPEKCLDLPVPQNKTYKVVVGPKVSGPNVLYFNSGKGGIDLISRILSSEVEDPSNPITVVIDPILLENEYWVKDLYENSPEGVYDIADNLEDWLNIHEKTKRSGSVKEMALRNVVVRGILNIITDANTQFNLQIPISMDEQRAAANLSTMSAAEQELTSDNPSAKVLMQGQNMVGRDVIGIGAASLKGFFAASTYFNINASTVAELLKKKNSNPNDFSLNSKIFNLLLNNIFNSKFSNRGLITLANINYKDALEQLGTVDALIITNEDLAKITNNNNRINDYINGNEFNIKQLLIDLDNAANGSWNSPIDAAFSLSGLISAATDNAKELILAKINATSKFADIYTYLLSIGESFETIANFMRSPEFNVVADYADGNMMDSSTRWFDLEHALNFVLDEETLPNMENKVFSGLLTTTSDQWNFITQLLYGEKNTVNRKRFLEEVAQNDLGVTPDFSSVQDYLTKILAEQKDKKGDDYTPEYQRLVKFVYNVLRNDLSTDELLLNLLKEKVESTKVYKSKNDNEEFEAVYFEDALDEDYYQDLQDESEHQTKAYWFNPNSLKHNDWADLYRYVKLYLIPKNEALQGITDLSNLNLLRDEIIPALKEQRVLGRILSVNQGLNTKDFDEYKWIRDIESFVNERFINSSNIENVQAFDFIRFLNDSDYRQEMINNYEKVKSTYNILAICTSADQFNAMLQMAGKNRKLIEKSYIIKAERKLADKLLLPNKKKVNGLSIGLTQKFYESEFQKLKLFTEYLITANWIGTLGDLSLRIPYNRNNPKKYFYKGTDMEFNPGDILDNMTVAEMRQFITDNEFAIVTSTDTDRITLAKTIRDYVARNNIDKVFYNGSERPFSQEIKRVALNDTDGMATFKWLMEHHIIDKLKEHPQFKNNPFIKALQLSSKFDPITGKEIEFYSLDVDLGNAKDNTAIENLYNLYLTGFNQIQNEKLPSDIGVTDEETGDWTICDLFYLYNLYINRDGFGKNSLTRIFDNVVLSDDNTTLLDRYYNYICRLDSGLESINDLDNLDPNLHGDGTPNLFTEARIALATEPTAARKFRSEFIPENQDNDYVKAHYRLLDETYGIISRQPINNIDKNYYLFPFVTSYNPIKINDTSEHAKLINRKKVQEFKVGGREAIEAIVKAMQDTFGDIIPIVAIDNSWFEREGKNVKNKAITKNASGFIYNGKIYINVEKADAGTPIHELMHAVFARMKFGSPEQRALYYKLLKSPLVSKDNSFYQKWYDLVKSKYEDIAVGSDLQEEVLVHVLSNLFASGYLSHFKADNPDSIITTSYTELQQEVYKAIADIFAVKLPELSKKNIETIMNIPLSQLILDFSSSLFNFNGNTLTRVYIPISQKLAEFKLKAAKNNEDTGAQLIISGEC